MIEVAPNLFVGSAEDEATVRDDPEWFVVSAARDPWHRRAVGYTSRGAPKGPEYLVALRERRLALNLIDSDDVAYIPVPLIDAAVDAIKITLPHQRVLLHCNKGGSRAPTIAMLYLKKYTDKFDGLDYPEAAQRFKEIYPAYAPAKGMADYAAQHWSD